jgi:hypothetical protein
MSTPFPRGGELLFPPTKTSALGAWALACLLLSVAGCSLGSGDDRQIEVATAPELSSYRDAAVRGIAAVDWIEPATAGSEWSDPPDARSAASAAISASAGRLAAVDYVSLSLPDFVTQTRALDLQPGDFTGDGTGLEAYAQEQDGESRWVLYRWEGPEFPKHPERPQVYRWVHVYALYDPVQQRIVRLLATIRGEAQE